MGGGDVGGHEDTTLSIGAGLAGLKDPETIAGFDDPEVAVFGHRCPRIDHGEGLEESDVVDRQTADHGLKYLHQHGGIAEGIGEFAPGDFAHPTDHTLPGAVHFGLGLLALEVENEEDEANDGEVGGRGDLDLAEGIGNRHVTFSFIAE